MRKVLLATTALATVSAVAAANAEVSLSGYYKFIYASVSDNTSTDRDGMSADTEVAFKRTRKYRASTAKLRTHWKRRWCLVDISGRLCD